MSECMVPPGRFLSKIFKMNFKIQSTHIVPFPSGISLRSGSKLNDLKKKFLQIASFGTEIFVQKIVFGQRHAARVCAKQAFAPTSFSTKKTIATRTFDDKPSHTENILHREALTQSRNLSEQDE